VLSSIFPEEIQFDGKKSPTPKLDEALLLILSIDMGSGTKEKKKKLKNWGLSLQVEPLCLFSNSFQDDLNKLTTILKSVKEK